VDELKRRVRITHPFHPRFGEELEFLECRGSFGGERVEGRDGKGDIVTVPLFWTDAYPEDPFVALSAGRSFLRPRDLLMLSDLIRELAS
jgi:hypothetical protein